MRHVSLFLRGRACADCGEYIEAPRRVRCPICAAHEQGRVAGYEEGDFSRRQYFVGVMAILQRWPGTTT